MTKIDIIDSHQHFWAYNPVDYDWIDPHSMGMLQHDFLPEDLSPIIQECGVTSTIAVQALSTERETNFLIHQAKEHEFIAGVVGWIDLTRPDLEDELGNLKGQSKLVGFRHILQSEPASFFQNEAFINGLKCLGRQGYTYDILVYADQLEDTIHLVDQLPAQALVIDHLAKPNIAKGEIGPWREQINRLASFPHISCKVSGLVTEANWSSWKIEDLIPYLDTVFEAFGIDRCMYGSDWPVCLCAADSYLQVLEITRQYLSSSSDSDRIKFFNLNAYNFYGLGNQ